MYKQIYGENIEDKAQRFKEGKNSWFENHENMNFLHRCTFIATQVLAKCVLRKLFSFSTWLFLTLSTDGTCCM
jgi:hypothetical protein